MKTLPKSLHTVTALARLADYLAQAERYDAERAMTDAFRILGYDRAADPYGLADRALAAMQEATRPDLYAAEAQAQEAAQ